LDVDHAPFTGRLAIAKPPYPPREREAGLAAAIPASRALRISPNDALSRE
jgi:hypothetical protein